MVAPIASALLLLLLQLSLPIAVIGTGCTKEINSWKASKDCKSYYWCSWGVVGQFYDCVHSELYDETTNQCVNPNKSDFKCPGLNWRDDDPEDDEVLGHTLTTAGSLTNPNKMFCSTDYIGQLYTGECGEVQCPSGQHTECPGNQRCYMMTSCTQKAVIETPPPAPELSEIDLSQIDFGNPGNWFCSSVWNPESYDGPCGYPCPNTSDQACPSGQKCFANQPNCQDQGLKFMGWTEVVDVVMSEAAKETDRWCGKTFDDMATRCAKACPFGTDDECDFGEVCFADSPCKSEEVAETASDSGPTISPKPTISPQPTPPPTTPPPTSRPTRFPTASPTEDPNPHNSYCKSGWEGECGPPCPTGFNNECEEGQFCFQHQTDCKEAQIEQAKIAATRWCGKTFDDMSERCHKPCPDGTDEECPDGENCFADSLCASEGTTAEIEEKARNSVGKMWCGKSYKDLVENCPKECPNGSDEECGDDMICFNMSEEERSCSEAGAGVRAKVDSENLWCGETWLHMLENCPKACPEGSDEECGDGMTCYDMSNEDKKCQYVGYGVKDKDNPAQRFCGETYAKMHESCPKKCPSGANDECPGNMQCFSNSECQVEGVGVMAVVELDPSKMFCGEEYADAAACGIACPSGGTEGECPVGQSCFADVVCSKAPAPRPAPKPEPVEEPVEESKMEESKMEESKPEPAEEQEASKPAAEESEAEESKPAEESEVEESESTEESETEEESKESDPSTMYCGTAFSDASKCSTPCPSGGTDEECPSGESCYADVKCKPPATESEPLSKAETFLNMIGGDTQPAQSSNNLAPSDAIVIENLEIMLYGLTELTSAHVYAFEKHAATYMEKFYNTGSATNNVLKDSVANVDTSLDVLKVEGPSRRNLRAKRALISKAYRMIYLQRISYDADLTISLLEVIEYPLSTWERRDDFVAYLKAQAPSLFSSLGAVSAVIITDDMFVEDGTPQDSSMIRGDTKFEGFQCHNTGVACPSGECNGGDVCMFFAQGSGVTPSANAPVGSSVTSSVGPPVDSPFNSPASVPATSPTSSSSSSSANSPVISPTSLNQQQQQQQQQPVNSPFNSPASVPANSPTSPSSSSSANSPALSPSSSSTSLNQQQQQQPNTPSFTEPVPAVDPEQEASVILDSVLEPEVVEPEQNGNIPVFSDSKVTKHGVTDVYGEMVIHGTNLVVADHLRDWDTFTVVYLQNFYNSNEATRDYVQASVRSIKADIQIQSVELGTAEVRTTNIKFKIPISWETTDDSISFITIVSQPFVTKEYRESYIKHMKSYLPGTFSVVTDVSSLIVESESDVTNSEFEVSNTFFCGLQWPVDCNSPIRCSRAGDCPNSQSCFLSSNCLGSKPVDEIAVNVNEENSDATNVQQTETVEPIAEAAASESTAGVPAGDSSSENSATNSAAEAPASESTAGVPAGDSSSESSVTNSAAEAPASESTAGVPAGDSSSESSVTNSVAEASTTDSTSPEVSTPQSTTEDNSLSLAKSPCSLCEIDQIISSYNQVTFNRKSIQCAVAHDSISDFVEGSASCSAAKEALAEACCVDLVDSNVAAVDNTGMGMDTAGNTNVAAVDSTNVSTSNTPVVVDNTNSAIVTTPAVVDNTSSAAVNTPTVVNKPSSSAADSPAVVDNTGSAGVNTADSSENSNVESAPNTGLVVVVDDQWNTNQSGKPVEGSAPAQDTEVTEEVKNEADYEWFAKWESYKETSSSWTRSVGIATVLSIVVLEIVLA